MSESITRSEWVRAFEAVLATRPADDEGMDRHEIQDALKMSEGKVGDLLRSLHRQGRLASGRGYRQSIDGRMLPVPVYRLK